MTDDSIPGESSPGATRGAVRLPGWLATVCRTVIVLALPPFLVLTAVRLVMSEAFIRLEYGRPGFPADRYGFTPDERLRYAPYTVRYLLDNEPMDYLAALEHGGAPLFTQKELGHMRDVQRVTQVAFGVHLAASALLLAAALALGWRHETRRALRQGFFEGGVLTILLMLTAIVLALTNWDFFFTSFHKLFFEGDSWLFSTRATLIRLFPERFWFDAALAIGGLTFMGTLSAIAGARLAARHSK